MDNQDRDLILGLANRLRQAPAVPQDPQAAELIAQQIASQPNSLYLLVQAVLVQEDALRQAQERIAALSAAPAPSPSFTSQPGHAPNPAFSSHPGYAHDQHNQGSGGFLSRTFGQRRDNNAYPAQGQQGGGFLKTAAAAAAGVAGGALLVAGASELFSDDNASSHQAQGGEDEGGFGMTDLF